jgi:hypothetical protein
MKPGGSSLQGSAERSHGLSTPAHIAKALGITFPTSLLVGADEVIEDGSSATAG